MKYLSSMIQRTEKYSQVHNEELKKDVEVVRKLAESLKNGHPDDPQEYIRRMEELRDAEVLLSKKLAEDGYDPLELHPEYKTADELEVVVLPEFYEHYFEKCGPISGGSWGHIFEAKSKQGGPNSAVQIMVEQNVANLQDLNKAKKEVEALAALTHPNVVKYRSAWIQLAKVRQEQAASFVTQGSSVKALFYIEMEVCRKNLPAWLAKRNETLAACQKPDDQTVQDGLKIFRQVMEGVKYVHANGIAHHDIQPHSILFGLDNVPKIGDFRFPSINFLRPSNISEVAKLLHQGKIDSEVESTEENVTYPMKEDIYEMGRILVELICPFPSLEEIREELKKIDDGVMRVLRPYPENLRKLILAMRNKDPDQRPTAQQVLDNPLFLKVEHST